MISLADYFGPRVDHPDATQQMWENAGSLLDRVNRLLEWSAHTTIDPDTGTQVSGSSSGSGDGGFRPHDAKTGSQKSKHKSANAVDVYDPKNELDTKLDDAVLARFDLYREHPDSTNGWCHLQDVPPMSGHRTFKP